MVSNASEYVIQHLLNDFFGDEYCLVRGQEGNGEGHDIETSDNTKKRIQCKLTGVYDAKEIFSGQISGFETTRRNSQLNQNQNDTGHVAYKANEFDYLWYTILHNTGCFEDLVNHRRNMNTWYFCLIPVELITDQNTGNCKTTISKEILNRSLIKRA